MESPPKRMTRARAAAKAGEPTTKTTKIVTAAARAKSTATSQTRSTAAKRKTRSDEQEDGEDEEAREIPARRARGRPRKVDAEEAAPEAPARATRGRPAKKTATEESNQEPAAPVRATRGRPRKMVAEAPAEEEEAAPEPAKRTRGRPAGATSKTTTTAAKSGVKKTVTFQEPDKENMEPPTKAKDAGSAGLRGRPARRGATTTARATRAVSKTSAASKKPLSPKKVTQMPIPADDESEDELAGSSTPVKPMKQAPIKPPSALVVKDEPAAPNEEDTADQDTVGTALDAPELPRAVLNSPAKRPPASPFKDAMKSPARRMAVPLPGSSMKPSTSADGQGHISSFKSSLLQSPAKRPQSPIKGLAPSSNNNLSTQHSQSAMKASLLQSPAKRAIPGLKPVTEPRNRNLEEPSNFKSLTQDLPAITRPSAKLMMEYEAEGQIETTEEVFAEPLENLQFPGRLSAVLPRHADPALKKELGLEELVPADDVQEASGEAVAEDIADDAEATDEDLAEPVEEADDPMAVDAAQAEAEDAAETGDENTSPPQSPDQEQNPMFQLREKDLDPCQDMESDSEDEATAHVAVPLTPTPFARNTPRTSGRGRSPAKASRASMGGFTALAERFGSWSAGSPIKMAPLAATGQEKDCPVSPAVSHFFEDEMSVRPETETQTGEVSEIIEVGAEVGGVQEPSFDDIMVIDEDVALAHEANEMSLLEPEVLDEVVNSNAFDDTLSEDSQEYGDENEVPIDPAMARQPVTPVRPVAKIFNTTTKVPLKPSDDSTPSPLKKRSFSASRVAPKRPAGPMRNATVISYSPKKERKSLPGGQGEDLATLGPVTPSRSELWSSMGTPARTPRRDVDPALLRGAIVFVDVHTSEGADASSIFVELLTQMGAKCMKSWNWSPTAGETTPSNKVGITHVVYKDGGKRTLEKVRQTNGLVQCVGVSWVLDCERENEWLDESSYYINTKKVPRGGARRRKSMEPIALANMNGTLVSTPNKGSARKSLGTPMNRRDSTAWMFTPPDQGGNEEEEEEEEDHEWTDAILTPVPKTPAPEAVARYAADLAPETPSMEDDDEDLDDSPTKQNLLMRTCPPKSNPFRDLGAGVLGEDKDEQVLLRLMAARRKSLQFAPKIGSPLARQWQ